MIPNNMKSVLSEFRASRGQIEQRPKESPKPPTRKRSGTNSPYESFIRKYNNLEETIDDDPSASGCYIHRIFHPEFVTG